MTSTTLPRSELTPGLSGWRGGEGPPLLLIHGVGLCADAWAPMLPFLTRHFAVTALDLPGHGDSPNLPDGHDVTLQDYSDRIAELLSSWGGRSLVVGHSLGALIALDLAIRHSQRVSAIAPLNSVFRRSEDASKSVMARLQELDGSNTPDPTQTLIRWFGETPKGEDAVMADHCRRWLTEVDPLGYRRAYSVFASQDGPTDDDLKKLACPALFVTGSKEPNSTPDMSSAMARLTPRGRAVIIDGGRHMMPMTHAAEVCAHLLEFCKHLDGTHERF